MRFIFKCKNKINYRHKTLSLIRSKGQNKLKKYPDNCLPTKLMSSNSGRSKNINKGRSKIFRINVKNKKLINDGK